MQATNGKSHLPVPAPMNLEKPFPDNPYIYADLEKIRILQVTNRMPWPLNDGGNLATFAIAKHLGELGHSVVLATLNTNKHWQDPAHLASVAEVHAVDIDTSLRPIPMALGLLRSIPYNIARFRSAEFDALLVRLVKEKKPDFVQMEGSYQALFVPAIRAVSDVPILLRSHNMEWRIWERMWANEKNPLKRFYLKDMYRKIRRCEEETLHSFDGVVAITEEDEAWYRDQGFKGKLTTVNAGADLSRYVPGKEWPPENRVGFIGSMEWEPNVQGVKWFLEEVWPKVHAANPKAEFHVAGKNPAPWMAKWNDIPGVEFHGMVDDAIAFLRGIGVFVVPLLSGSGMRLKIVEALAMKKCVLSTAVGAEGISVTHGKDVLLADSPKDFANSLLQLIGSPERARLLATQGHATILEAYYWRVLILKFVDFYKGLP